MTEKNGNVAPISGRTMADNGNVLPQGEEATQTGEFRVEGKTPARILDFETRLRRKVAVDLLTDNVVGLLKAVSIGCQYDPTEALPLTAWQLLFSAVTGHALDRIQTLEVLTAYNERLDAEAEAASREVRNG